MKSTNLPHPPPPTPSAELASMRKLNRAATKVFLALVDGLLVGSARRIDNAAGASMVVSVDYLVGGRVAPTGTRDGSLYAVAHRYEVNGDLVPDPDVEFYVVDDPVEPARKAVYPTAIDHGPLGYRRHVHFDSTGQPVRVASRGQVDLAIFCDLWMTNIAIQQGLVLS